jgi:hypothetical protein
VGMDAPQAGTVLYSQMAHFAEAKI